MFFNKLFHICKDGYYLSNNNKCLECDSNCKTCKDNSTSCTSCNTGKFLYKKEKFGGLGINMNNAWKKRTRI